MDEARSLSCKDQLDVLIEEASAPASTESWGKILVDREIDDDGVDGERKK